MIHITEEKLRAAIQICLGGDSIYTEKREANLVHDIKALSIADVRKSLIDFANFIGDRPLPEYSKSINKWRWWDNNLRDYKTASTEELLSEWEKSINVF